MSDPYLAEVKIFAGDFAPQGWALCNGQVLPISQNTALFSLLGTNYGGNGTTTFALPNLQGRIALHNTGSFPLGQAAGEAVHTLEVSEMASHTHALTTPTCGISQTVATDTATTNLPGPATILAKAVKGSAPISIYTASSASATLPATLPLTAGGETDAAGGSQPHNNLQPYLVLNFIIALQGIFPPRN